MLISFLVALLALLYIQVSTVFYQDYLGRASKVSAPVLVSCLAYALFYTVINDLIWWYASVLVITVIVVLEFKALLEYAEEDKQGPFSFSRKR